MVINVTKNGGRIRRFLSKEQWRTGGIRCSDELELMLTMTLKVIGNNPCI